MRKLFVVLMVSFLVGLPLVGFAASMPRVALVIGNSNYKNAPLKNPVNDATDIGNALQRLGFHVTMLRDADQRAMESAVRQFGKKLTKGGVGLFYYAGHGMQVDGRNYLIPVDAKIESPSDIKYEALDAGRVLGKMEDAGNDMNIVILDACRDNPFSRSWRSGQKGLARMDAPKGSYIAYATAPGSVAADGSGRNGVYTQSLLHHIETQGLALESVMKRVRKDVIAETGSKQVPWASTSLVGDFYFSVGQIPSQPSARAISVQKRPFPQNLNAEEEMWEIVKTSEAIEDYTVFLDEYPNSRFGGAARLKIQQLKRLQNAQTMTAAVAPAAIKPKPARPAMPLTAAGTGVVESDGNFVKYSTGIVYDQKTGLEWYAGPDEDTDWSRAQLWASGLQVDGGHWRLPFATEIKTLYNKGQGTRNMSPLFKTTGSSVWYADSALDANASDFNRQSYYFKGRGRVQKTPMSANNKIRAFAVRSPKKVAQIGN